MWNTMTNPLWSRVKVTIRRMDSDYSTAFKPLNSVLRRHDIIMYRIKHLIRDVHLLQFIKNTSSAKNLIFKQIWACVLYHQVFKMNDFMCTTLFCKTSTSFCFLTCIVDWHNMFLYMTMQYFKVNKYYNQIKEILFVN